MGSGPHRRGGVVDQIPSLSIPGEPSVGRHQGRRGFTPIELLVVIAMGVTAD
jgi:hypothetical protein